MKFRLFTLLTGSLLPLMVTPVPAQESPRIEIEMETTRIRSNRELPKLLYIIPWRDTELSDRSGERKILIPDLFSDYYEPLLPREAKEQSDDSEGLDAQHND
ncbi:hypothetical protein OOT55_16555 [Marinimicrobium sp. C6131]|uniref:hypothetical protein n=1 Tax=Marinimicrobium sp. C6131 TaxID=3022676 RepID=UPI00223CFDA1|nr:hypothetical protein [Marinimicrobium sp. C6131]UZJ44252.1 hypothetical protein OOT55_16555 [Marinimicrobium sp. C6131]